jgi:hypothetical protein
MPAAFEYDWREITELPSRLSATGYSGLRIAKSGRRFWIEGGIVWQLIDRDGAVRGQAATFSKWRDA